MVIVHKIMILQWFLQNAGTAVELIVLVGTWFIFFGKYQERNKNRVKEVNEKFDLIDKRFTGYHNKLDAHVKECDDKLDKHMLDDPSPHKNCIVEIAQYKTTTDAIVEIKNSIARMENWVVALASKAGIKEPKNGN